MFGICLVKTKSYCTFQSRLGRILIEQGRPQLGLGWGDPSAPDCSGFTIAQLQSIDFSKIDFSEIYPSLMSSVTVPDPAATASKISTNIGSYFSGH